VRPNPRVPPADDSPLALAELALAPGEELAFHEARRDALLYVVEGSGSVTVGEERGELVPGAAALVLAGEEASFSVGEDGLEVLVATVGPEADRHAPLGARELVVAPDAAGSERATGARSFGVFFGPHNGCTRATLFAGRIPPGKAPWHYHLYDEIVWVPEGPGRLYLGDESTELGPGSAFRLRPRQVHIVENAGDRELTIIGIFSPAGSPSAAYLEPHVAAEYRFAG